MPSAAMDPDPRRWLYRPLSIHTLQPLYRRQVRCTSRHPFPKPLLPRYFLQQSELPSPDRHQAQRRRISQRLAGATTLIISLGLMPQFWQIPVLMGAVLLLMAQAFLINRLAGIQYPYWRPCEIRRGTPPHH